MNPIKINRFGGLLPRVPDDLLPDNSATIAENCDFAYGHLRSMKDHYLLRTMPDFVASAFTEDGMRFYTWPDDADAVISPLVSGADSDRLYYTHNGEFRVTSRSGVTTSGGIPGTSYKVGVPEPKSAPELGIDQSAALLSIDGITPKIIFHYESRGLKYQEGEIAFSVKEIGKKYSVNIPDRIVSDKIVDPLALPDLTSDPTPLDATPVVRLIYNKPSSLGDDIKLDQYSSNSSFAKLGSDTVPISLTQDATNKLLYTIVVGNQTGASSLRTRAYVFTYANIYNEEGRPSPPATISVDSEAVPNISCKIESFAGFVPLKEIRVYRTADAGSSDEYFFSFAIPAIGLSGSASGKDKTAAALLNEVLSSSHYYPPKQSLHGLMNVGNGIFAAWFGSELWFSDAYKPWSWPPSYVKTFPWPIVGGEPQGTGALITTMGDPYVVSGISPDSMTADKLNVDQAGVSKWSIASVGGRIVYASNDGIVSVSGGLGSLEDSQTFFTREVWREKYRDSLGTMQFAEYDGALFVFSRTSAFTPFFIRMDEGKGAMSEMPDFKANGSFYLITSDGMYFSKGKDLYQFGGGMPLPIRWQSKEIRLPDPISYGAANVICDGDFTIEFYAMNEADDFVLIHTERIVSTKNKSFRLPALFKSDCWKIRISGSGIFKVIKMAGSFRQLAEL